MMACEYYFQIKKSRLRLASKNHERCGATAECHELCRKSQGTADQAGKEAEAGAQTAARDAEAKAEQAKKNADDEIEEMLAELKRNKKT